MAKIKKGGAFDNEQNLKRKDSKKSRSDIGSGILTGTPFGSGKKLPDSMVDIEAANVKVKKKLPVVVDIIAGILMLLIVAAAVVISYMGFRVLSSGYDNKSITYEIIINTTEGVEQYEQLVKQDVYFDTADNSIFFGKIVDIQSVEGREDHVLMVISVTAQYREGEGYAIGNKRIAVGSEFAKLRCGERSLGKASVVGLAANGGK